jgi:DNA-binding CsgD family transcriptional regulator
MATRGSSKSVEFKQAALATTPMTVVAKSASDLLPEANPTSLVKPHGAARPASASGSKHVASHASPVAAIAAKAAAPVPRFTSEETILLRGLASGASSKEMAAQMRLPRESLYRLIGDLRRKTGATSDTALAVWVLRNMSASERRGGAR